MYHAETDTPAVARTSNLNEELGQVSVATYEFRLFAATLLCFSHLVIRHFHFYCHLTCNFIYLLSNLMHVTRQ